MFYTDGDYYVVEFDDGQYFNSYGLYFSDKRTTNDIKEAHLFQFDWQVVKDIYLQQFLYNKDIQYKIKKVKVDVNISMID